MDILKKITRFILISVIILIYSPSIYAVEQCGNYTSSGNLFPCSNGGNCTWWASKKAMDVWGISWGELPSTRHAMYWDDDAKNKAGYSLSTTPVVGSIGVKNSSVYNCSDTNIGVPGKCDYGHVAWVESVSGGNVTYTEMNYGVWGVKTKTNPINFFDVYISRGVQVKEFWKKADSIVLGGEFDAQFKLYNPTSKTITYQKVALSIHKSLTGNPYDLVLLNTPVQILPGMAVGNYGSQVQLNQGQTGFWGKTTFPITVGNELWGAGTYYLVAKVFDGKNWIPLDTQTFKVVDAPAKTLSSVNVVCPNSVNESSSSSCSAVASFSDGSTASSGFSWSENSSYASINSIGTLTTNAVSSNQSVTVTASYSYNGVTKSGSKAVTIKDVAKSLSNVSVTCPSSVNESSNGSCSAVASFSDGSTVSSGFSWSENSSYASINSSGTLTTSAVSSNQSVTVTASYSYNGVTKSGSKAVTIKDVAKSLSSVSVTCPGSVNESSNGSCSAVASFSDGSTVSNGFSWSENSSYASINSSGTLTTSAVSSNQSVTVTASYSYNGVTKSGSKAVTIKDVAKSLSSVSVTCPGSVNESSSGSCSAVASFSDGSTASSGFSWSENSSYASINSSGTLTTSAVSSNQSVTVTASYSYNGVTKSGSKAVTINDVPPAYDGKDPISMGCDLDATTVAYKTITGGVIELRYSKKCGTNWARTRPTSSSSTTYAKVTRSSDGRSYSNSGKGNIWTAMVYSPTTVSCAEGKIGTVSASGACK